MKTITNIKYLEYEIFISIIKNTNKFNFDEVELNIHIETELYYNYNIEKICENIC